MGTLNKAGVALVHRCTRPLAIDTMDAAAEAIAKHIARGPSSSTTPEAWARHLAWVIGFDTLIDDRKRIHGVTQFVVEDDDQTPTTPSVGSVGR